MDVLLHSAKYVTSLINNQQLLQHFFSVNLKLQSFYSRNKYFNVVELVYIFNVLSNIHYCNNYNNYIHYKYYQKNNDTK